MDQDQALMEHTILDYLQRSGSWNAARALAGRYFGDQGTKFTTCLKYDDRWIAVQWVTTSSRLFDTAAQVYPGRVAISRRRQKAMRRLAYGRWIAATTEPSGPTIAVQIFGRFGK